MTLKFEATTVKATTRSSTARPHLVVSGGIPDGVGLASCPSPCKASGTIVAWTRRPLRELRNQTPRGHFSMICAHAPSGKIDSPPRT